MTYLLAASSTSIIIDVALTFGGFFFGCAAALIYAQLSTPDSKPQPEPAPPEPNHVSTVNDVARANMAAQQLRDLAHNVASDVGAHNSLVEGISDQLGSLKSGAQGNDDVVMGAVTKMLEANKKLAVRLEDAEQKIQAQAEEIRTQQSEARTDALTKLANRRAFDACLDENFQASRTGGRTFSLMLMDVDYFKRFNDDHGHPAGDEVLRCVGRTLNRIVKSGDLACRYGGEEFAVVMANTNVVDGKLAAERIRRAIEAMPVNFAGEALRVTVSVGVAECQSDDDASKFLRRADDAVYASKKAGRNCSHWHDGAACLPIVAPKAMHEANGASSAASPASAFAAANLPDRTAFVDELRRRVAEIHRTGGTISLVHYRVKDLQKVEHNYGAAVGALLLDALAIFIRSTLRDMDLLGRLDAGEFIVMLPGSSESAARIVGQRVKASISTCPVPLGDQSIRLELDMGVTSVLASDDAISAMAAARTAMENAAVQELADAGTKTAEAELAAV